MAQSNTWLAASVSITTCLLLIVKPVWCDEESGNPIIVPKRNLSCHECYRSVQGEVCLTLQDTSKVKVQKCDVDELFCVVEKYRSDGELTTFTRKCAKDCLPGCQTAGTYYKEEYCYHCCQQNLCNNVADSGAHNTRRTFTVITGYMAGILATLWMAK